jgi:UPF0716 family protein affecting phage T7 exclusion
MNLRRLIPVAILLLPTAEIACFVVVASRLGLGRAVVLLLGLSFLGVLLLRRAGAAQFAALKRQFGRRDGGVAALDASGLVSIAAAILLLVPGYITAVLGLALWVVPIPWLSRAFGRGRPDGGAAAAPSVIDLEPDEWHVEAPRDEAAPRLRGR